MVWCVLAECGAVDVPRACPTLNCLRCGFYTVADASLTLSSSEPLPVRASPSLLLPTQVSSPLCVSAASLQRTREAVVVSTMFTVLVLAPLLLCVCVCVRACVHADRHTGTPSETHICTCKVPRQAAVEKHPPGVLCHLTFVSCSISVRVLCP